MQATAGFKADIANSCTLDKFHNDERLDPNINYEILNSIIHTALAKNMPTKVVKYHKHKHKKTEWITAGILRSIKFRDDMYKRLKSTPCADPLYNTLKVNLKTYNNILRNSIRTAKASYFHSCFERYKNDIKSTWTTIKEIINKTSKNREYPETFVIDNENINDINIIVNKFNHFFINIGPTLANNIPNSNNKNFEKYLQNMPDSQFSFQNVNETMVIKIIDKLKPKTSCGKDKISNKLLKLIKCNIAPVLTLIINQSINTGKFPDHLKIAKVLPVHKKDSNNIFSNYRPISILSSVSKVFERVIHDQLYEYFATNDLFYHSQYGFRQKHSTELAALEIVDRIVCAMDKNEIPLNIFLDLSKAFDTLDHQILISKLRYYGLYEKSLCLLQNYLSNRKQYVVLGDCHSDLLPITTGVPQGSILGPLLFIIYLNDLVKACNVFVPIIYADDTALFTILQISRQDKSELENYINNELSLINSWFKANKLSLNGNKSKAMIFHTKQRKVEPIHIEIDGLSIEFVNHFNYLGIDLDCHLSWKIHTDKISKKISKTIGIMTRLKHFLPDYIMLTLYNSLISPYLNYGLLVWGTCCQRVIKLQKKAMRVISNAKYNSHTEPIFKKFEILKIQDLFKVQDLKFYYKLQNGLLPKYFSDNLITQQSEVHSYYTRHANDYRNPVSRHIFVQNSIRYRLPSIINTCPSIIKDKVCTHCLSGYIRYIKHDIITSYQEECLIVNCYICQNTEMLP
jgi:hypothetical protein